jgi:hypothetical protein
MKWSGTFAVLAGSLLLWTGCQQKSGNTEPWGTTTEPGIFGGDSTPGNMPGSASQAGTPDAENSTLRTIHENEAELDKSSEGLPGPVNH